MTLSRSLMKAASCHPSPRGSSRNCGTGFWCIKYEKNSSHQPVWHSAGDASRLAALLLPQIHRVFSVVAPCQPGASPPSVPRRVNEMSSTPRVFNFSSGPAVLPLPVLEEAQRDLVSLPGVGMSVLEISHRSKPFDEILHGAFEDMRAIAGIPKNYRILFLQGGASLQ